MANFNETASQILNGVGNFLNGVSNKAREITVDTPVDMISTAAKGYTPLISKVTGASQEKMNQNIDKAADVLKGTNPNSLQRQPVDPTSTAQAIGEGLTEGVDIAASVLTLTELAKQLPKAAQKGWKAILNKVKDAKSKQQQRNLAKEAREYIDQHSNFNAQKVWSREDVPAYQQRRHAEFFNEVGSSPSVDGVMEPYRGMYMPNNGEMKTYRNVTDAAKNGDFVEFYNKIDPDSKTFVDAYRTGYPKNTVNDLTSPIPVNSTTTSDANGIRFQQYRKWTYGDRLKQSNQSFVDAAQTPRSKAIRTDEAKWANDLGMTAEQLRAEAKKYGGSTEWYYRQRKELEKLGVNNFEDYAKAQGLNGGTPNIHDVKEYNRAKTAISL